MNNVINTIPLCLCLSACVNAPELPLSVTINYDDDLEILDWYNDYFGTEVFRACEPDEVCAVDVIIDNALPRCTGGAYCTLGLATMSGIRVMTKPANRILYMSTLAHELGHVLGYRRHDSHGLMCSGACGDTDMVDSLDDFYVAVGGTNFAAWFVDEFFGTTRSM